MDPETFLYIVRSSGIISKFFFIHLEYTLILKSTSRKLNFSNMLFSIHSFKKVFFNVIELVLTIVGQIFF